MKYMITLNGKNYEVEVNESEAVLGSITDVPVVAAQQSSMAQQPQASAPAQATVQGTKVLAPMPGTILKINAAEGESVKAGQVLAVLEAMKMENEIMAPADGTVKQIMARRGASVKTDDVLLVI